MPLLPGLSTLGVVLLAGTAWAWEPLVSDGGLTLKWAGCDHSFWVNNQGSDDLELAQIEKRVLEALSVWANASCAGLTASYEGLTGETEGFQEVGQNTNVVAFREAPGSWPPEVSGVVAMTVVGHCVQGCTFPGEIIDADIVLNGVNFTFTDTIEPGRVRADLLNTLVHEFGHFLGFDHSAVTGASLFETANDGELLKRDLHLDDVDAVCTTYPETYCRSPLPVAGRGCDCDLGGDNSRSAPLWIWAVPLGLSVGRRRRARFGR